MSVRSTISGLLDFVLPSGCVVCRGWVPSTEARGSTGLLCAGCRSRLATASWPRCPRCHHPRGTGRVEGPVCLHCASWPAALGRARFACVLAPPASDLVHALKYEGWSELAPLMGRRMASVARELLAHEAGGSASIVVPVPTTPKRERARGYNQARLLADATARVLGRPLVDALRRSRAITSQTALTPDQRRDNVRGAFEGSATAAPVAGASVLLVDDVLTTGATASEAAGALVRAGARRVDLVAFARALPRLDDRAA